MAHKMTISFPAGEKTGTFLYEGSGDNVSATCWWDVSKIDSGTYENCRRTNMDESGYDSVFIKAAKVSGTVVNNRFVHHGIGTVSSLGCIAVETAKIQSVLPRIKKNEEDVTVVIRHG